MISRMRFLIASLTMMLMVMCPGKVWAETYDTISEEPYQLGLNDANHKIVRPFTPSEDGYYTFTSEGFQTVILSLWRSTTDITKISAVNGNSVKLEGGTKYYVEVIELITDENEDYFGSFQLNIAKGEAVASKIGLYVAEDKGTTYAFCPSGYTTSITPDCIMLVDGDYNIINYMSGKYVNMDMETGETTLSLTPMSIPMINQFTFVETNPLPIPATKVGDKYYGTFYSPFTVTLGNGQMAYYPHIDKTTGDIVIDDQNCSQTINANQGVIIIAEDEKLLDNNPSGICFYAHLNGTPVDLESDLTGTVPTITNPGNALVLGLNNGELGFYGYNKETLHGFKAYIDNSEGMVSNGRIRYVGNDGTTSIIGTTTANETTEAYSISGQRVSANYKGIVIVNGKKVINK